MKKLLFILAILIPSVSYAVFPPCATPGELWREGNKTYVCSVSGAWKEIDTDNHENVIRYGAKCDGSTDNTTPIQNAINTASTNGRIVYIPPCASTYNFASQITNASNVPFIGEGILNFTGSGEDAFVWGSAIGQTTYSDSTISVVKIERNSIDFTDQFAGVVIKNVSELKIRLQANNFYNGVKLLGDPAGVTHGEFYLNEFTDNLIGLKIENDNTGFVIQNTFFNGDFQNTSSTNVASVVRNLELSSNGSFPINGLVFLNPSFQPGNQNITGAVAIYATGTQQIRGLQFFGVRYESLAVTKGFLGGDNEFVGNSFYMYKVEDVTTNNELILATHPRSKTNLVQNKFESQFWGETGGSFNKLASFSRADMVQSASGVWAPSNAVWVALSAALSSQVYSFLNVELQEDYLRIPILSSSRAMAIKLDLSNEDRDYMRKVYVKTKLANPGGRLAFVALDSGSSIINNVDYAPDGFFVSGNYYYQSIDMSSGVRAGLAVFDVSFHPSMDTVWIGASGGTADLNLEEIEFYIPAGAKIKQVKDTNGITIATDSPVANEIPSTPGGGNDYPTGQLVLNSEPSVGEALGWRFDGSNWQSIGINGQLLKYTSDPCGTLSEGTLFYNDTSNYTCYCNGANDVKTLDDTTDCF